ncbi:MAG TPA: hypothetical protein VGQ88_08880, partial [Burkholderiales bacterium]|nr:hypothetical protein [Burkholderiales bacterium]
FLHRAAHDFIFRRRTFARFNRCGVIITAMSVIMFVCMIVLLFGVEIERAITHGHYPFLGGFGRGGD